MKKLMAVLLALTCSACAPVVTKVNVPDMAKSDALSVSDMRPASEKDRKIFSLLITSHEYGIIRTGDAGLSPTSVRLLQHQVFEKFIGADHSAKLVVYHFVVYENMKSQFRSAAAGGAIGGLVGGLVGMELANHVAMAHTQIVDEQAFDNLSSNEYQRGLFTEAENPKKAAVYIVYIDTDIDGKRLFTRTLSSVEIHGDQNSLVNAVQLAIKNHLAKYGAPATLASATRVSATEVMPGPVPAADANPTAAPSSSPATAGASASATVASLSSPASPASAVITSKAQTVATQMRCGTVQSNGDSTFVAPCGSYGVLIDCDGEQCRPMHTVRLKSND